MTLKFFLHNVDNKRNVLVHYVLNNACLPCKNIIKFTSQRNIFCLK